MSKEVGWTKFAPLSPELGLFQWLTAKPFATFFFIAIWLQPLSAIGKNTNLALYETPPLTDNIF